MPQPNGTEELTVRWEADRNRWYARDKNGTWRSHADADSRWPTAESAARAMFHADEIFRVRGDDNDPGACVVEIYTYQPGGAVCAD